MSEIVDMKVSDVIQDINDELAVMSDTIASLEKELDVILVSAPPGDAGSMPQDADVELINDLLGIERGITLRIAMLGNLMGRISL